MTGSRDEGLLSPSGQVNGRCRAKKTRREAGKPPRRAQAGGPLEGANRRLREQQSEIEGLAQRQHQVGVGITAQQGAVAIDDRQRVVKQLSLIHI